MILSVRRLEVILISLISLHSLILGTAMLFQPAFTLQLFGWNYEGTLFFPAQTGIFLDLFGGLFLAAIWHRKLIWFIIITKSSAVLFLISQYFLLSPDAPFTVIVAAVLDGLMGASIAAIYIWQVHKQTELSGASVGSGSTTTEGKTREIPGRSSEKQAIGSVPDKVP
jgi:hypothetical protein